MGTFLKVIGSICLLVVAVIVGMMIFSDSDFGYSPSNEILPAAGIAQNPYKYEGKSGIVDGPLFFHNMAGDNEAIYDVVAAPFGTQLAVRLKDNDAPRMLSRIRVYVEGTDDFTNGFGATVKIGEVRFEGYADPLPQPVPAQSPVQPDFDHFAKPPVTQPEPPAQSQPPAAPTIEPDQTSPDGTQPPAPIVRQPPPQD